MTGVPLPPVVEKIRFTAVGRKLMARVCAVWFMVYYLSAWYADHQRVWLETMRALQPGGRLLLLAPRAHGKTETVLSYVTQRIAEDRGIRVLIVCKNADAARKRLRRIKSNLEGNARLIRDYGRFKPKRLPDNLLGVMVENDKGAKAQVGYWTEKYIYVERYTNSTDPTLEAVGWRGAITGARFDLIILDDPIDDISAASSTERRKAKEWLYGTVLELLEPTGQALVIGTRKHHDDLYATLLEDPTFELRHDRAIEQWPEDYRGVYGVDRYGRRILEGVQYSGPTKVLWPERWPIKALLRKLLSVQSTVGLRLFLRENQNEVTDEATADFPMVFFEGGRYQPADDAPARDLPGCYDDHRSWLSTCLDGARRGPGAPTGVTRAHLGERPATDTEEYDATEGLIVVQSWDLGREWDPKRAEENDTDYTVGLTYVIDTRTWERKLVGIYRNRGVKPQAVIDAMKREYWRFGGSGCVYRVVVENVLFQAVYALMLQEGTDMPVLGHTTTSKKSHPEEGVPFISTLAENGKLRLPMATPEDRNVTTKIVVNELHAWPDGKHDDVLMALYVGERRVGMYQRALMALGEDDDDERPDDDRMEDDRA